MDNGNFLLGPYINIETGGKTSAPMVLTYVNEVIISPKFKKIGEKFPYSPNFRLLCTAKFQTHTF